MTIDPIDPIKQLSQLLIQYGPVAGNVYIKLRKYYEPQEAVNETRLILTFNHKPLTLNH
jgi:hypothetical protein